MSRVKVLFGTYFFDSLPKETNKELLNILKAYKVKDLDTAHSYVSSHLSGVRRREPADRLLHFGMRTSLIMCIDRKEVRRL